MFALDAPGYVIKGLTLDLSCNNRVENDNLTTPSLHLSIVHGSSKSFTQYHITNMSEGPIYNECLH